MAETTSVSVNSNDDREALKNGTQQQTDGTTNDGPASNTSEQPNQGTDTSQTNGGGDGNQQGDNQGEQKILGKFNNADELARAYAELERQFHQRNQQSQQQQQQQQQSQQQDQQGQQQDQQQDQQPNNSNLDSVRQDMNNVIRRAVAGNSITEEDYARLESQGIPRESIDMQVEGAKARTQEVQKAAYDTVGGKETYDQMMTWARDNLSEAEKQRFDQAVNTNDPATVELAVRAVKSKWQESGGGPENVQSSADKGQDPQRQLSTQGQATPQGQQAYQSWEEVKQDMQSKQYRRDPAFRQQVADKLSRSKI